MLRKLLRLISADSGFAIMSFGNSLSSIMAAIFFLYFATIMSVQDYGEINYFISFGFASFAISSLGLDTTIMTFAPKTGRTILFESYSLVLITSVIASAVTGIILADFTAALLVLAITCYSMSLVELVTTFRYKEYALLTIGSRLSQIALSLALFFWIGLDGFLLGYSIAYLIFGYRFFMGLKSFSLNFDELRVRWRFVAQVYGAGSTYTLLSYLDKIVVGYFFGYFVLGSYQFSFQVYTFLSILPHTLFNYILPHQVKGVAKKRIKIIGFALVCAIVTIVVWLTPIILPYIFPKYSHAISSIQILVLAIIPLTLVSFIRSDILAEGNRTRYMLYAGIISLATEVISIIVLGTLFGTNGVASALLLTMIAEFIFLLVANKGHMF